MEGKEVPPPYDGGYTNPGHGQPPYHPPQQPASYHPPQQPMAYHPPQQPVITQPTTVSSSTTVVMGSGAAGGCPVCHNGGWTGTYSCCAWLWCLCCFPCGIICCLCMRKKKCTKCGFTLG